MLFLLATPIGNLSDITLRALETMKTCDYLLCEDTRHSKVLLNHHSISTPLTSYHKFNEREKLDAILSDLENGKKIGLISDAGHPCINDPGNILVEACHERNIPVRILPGPSSVTAALSLSGLECVPFQFLGFIPKKEGEKRDILRKALSFSGITACFETPHQLPKTLTFLSKECPSMTLTLVREITKIHETVAKGTPEELLEVTHKGECVLLFSPNSETRESYHEAELMKMVLDTQKKYNLSLKKTAELLQEFKGIPKKQIYRLALPN